MADHGRNFIVSEWGKEVARTLWVNVHGRRHIMMRRRER